MNTRFLLSIPLCAAFFASAQVQFSEADYIRLHEFSRGAPAAKHAPKFSKGIKSSTRQNIEIIIRYESPEALDIIRENGGKIVSLVGTRTAIVSIAPQKATMIAAAKGVSGAKVSTLLKRNNDTALSFSNIPDIHAGKGIPRNFDGTGVVIGLFDTGIDPNHINFLDKDGNNRISVLYDYAGETAVPDVYDTPAKLSTFKSDTNSESHGTHVLGIMGGSFIDTSVSDAPDYRGVAPGAEIVACSGPGYNVQILDAMERIAKYAKDKGKPCVINLSFGDNLGPHDGSDEFTEAINDIAQKYDAVICLAGGNERDEAIAIIKQLTPEQPEVKTLLLKGSEEVEGYFQSFGSIEVWTEDEAPFTASLDIISRSKPNDVVYSFEIPVKNPGYVSQGTAIDDYLDTRRFNMITEGTKFHDYYSQSFMGGVAGLDSYTHRYTAQINAYLVSRSAANSSRYFVRLTVKGEVGKKIFIYCDGSYMNFGNRNIPGLDIPDGQGTNSNMASGKHTLAVGSYTSANRPKSGYQEGTIGEISYFSSFGETPDGRIMPDVCAPGQVIISSRNTHMSTVGNYVYYYPLEYSYKDMAKKTTYYWTSCAGTSQASPHMAGIAALWRQADPSLSYTDIQRIARETAVYPALTSDGWGYGKVDAMAGIKAIVGSSGVETVTANATEPISASLRPGGEWTIYAPGQDLISAEIYTLQGTLTRHISSDDDMLEINASSLPSGVYILKVTTPSGSRTFKVNK